jgi:hypothetical protein
VELGAQLRTGVSRSDSKGAYDVAVAAGSAVRIDRGLRWSTRRAQPSRRS